MPYSRVVEFAELTLNGKPDASLCILFINFHLKEGAPPPLPYGSDHVSNNALLILFIINCSADGSRMVPCSEVLTCLY